MINSTNYELFSFESRADFPLIPAAKPKRSMKTRSAPKSSLTSPPYGSHTQYVLFMTTVLRVHPPLVRTVLDAQRAHTSIRQTLRHRHFSRLQSGRFPHHFAGVRFGVAEGDVAVEVDLLVIPDELEDRDVEAAGERHAVLRHADGVVLDVWTPGEGQVLRVFRYPSFICRLKLLIGTFIPLHMTLMLDWTLPKLALLTVSCFKSGLHTRGVKNTTENTVPTGH